MSKEEHSRKNRKIGVFCGYYLPHLGGVERYVDKLSAALMKLGYEIVIVTSNHDNLPDVEDTGGRKVYRLPIRNLAKNRYPIPLKNDVYHKLIADIEAEGIDVFLLNTRFHLPSLIGAQMGSRLGKPVMLIEHGTGHFTVNNRFLDYFGKLYEHLLTWRIKKNVDRFYGVSAACNDWLKHFGIKAAGVFYNSIDAADGKQAKDFYRATYGKDTLVISYAGRLIKEKGVLNLLQAFSTAAKHNPGLKMKLLIAGDGPLFDDIQQHYQDTSIELMGRLDFEHMLALYNRTDIFVYPSLYPEGLPTSILEAGLMGCAVIATPRGGTAEVIETGKHGIITDGSPKQLSEAIERLSANAQERKDLASALKRRVEDVFNWKAVAEEVDREINNLNAG